MPRYAFKIEYDGHPFSGWQRQIDFPSVQGTIEDALAKIEPDAPLVTAAGRTDAGVHALAQVAHCDMAQDWTPFRLCEAVNFHLKPAPVAIVDVVRVDPEWHARFSAKERHYLYRVIARRPPIVHDRGLAWHVRFDLDVDLMRDAVGHLIGTHDFTTFRATHCQSKSPIKTLDEIAIKRIEHDNGIEIQFRLRARSFLHNQVRSIVGTLERVGTGKWASGRVKEALEAKDRDACGPVAPPEGLYLSGVSYDPNPF